MLLRLTVYFRLHMFNGSGTVYTVNRWASGLYDYIFKSGHFRSRGPLKGTLSISH